ncbi:MAG: hypothetical protein ACK5ZG_04820 [Phycisphaerae bacterium]|jgi:hypothetical protein
MDPAGMQQFLSSASGMVALALLVPFALMGFALWLWGRRVLRVGVALLGLLTGALLGLGLAQLQGGSAASILGTVFGAAAGVAIAIGMFRFTTALLAGATVGATTFCMCVAMLIDLPALPATDPAAMQRLAASVPGMSKFNDVTQQLQQLEDTKETVQQLQSAQAAGDTERLAQIAQSIQQPAPQEKPEPPSVLTRIENNIKTARSGLNVESTRAADGTRRVVIRSKPSEAKAETEQASKSIQLASADEPGLPSSMVVNPSAVFAGTPMDMPQFTVPWGKLTLCVVLSLVLGIGTMVACIEYHRSAVCIVSAALGSALLISSLGAAIAQLGGPAMGWILWLVCSIALAAAGAFVQIRKLPTDGIEIVKEKRSRNKFAVSVQDLERESRFNPLARATAAQRSSCAASAADTKGPADPFRDA